MLKALQESDNEPEPGKNHSDNHGEIGAQYFHKVVDDDNFNRRVMISNDEEFEKYSHFYEMALMLSQLNRRQINDDGNLFSNDKLID